MKRCFSHTAATAALILALMCAPVQTARADDLPLVAALSNHLVAITTGFTGANVLLFGATDGPGDIVIVIRGPTRDMTVRRKERFGLVWVNADSVTLRDAPSYYRIASSRALSEIASEQLLSRYQIGLEHVRLEPTKGEFTPGEMAAFREGLARLKTADGLYAEDIGAVNLMANRLFRTELAFPADVPTGTYEVLVYLFRDGQVTAAEYLPFTVSKIGPAADIYDFAHHYGFIYGFLAIIVAAASGYGASVAFRRT